MLGDICAICACRTGHAELKAKDLRGGLVILVIGLRFEQGCVGSGFGRFASGNSAWQNQGAEIFKDILNAGRACCLNGCQARAGIH